ncbi:hypothetical protein LCGC14_1109190 [marine sediment metagenome]|uniref:Uncharacterized protein n=1 Tax=marine sediment metagenome TaxID=412755 RepID=A0A0F9QDJ2_9ZZZZ
MKIELIRCLKHPRYKGKSKPRGYCLDCWRVWLNDPYAFRWMELSVKEIRRIMLLLGGHL